MTAATGWPNETGAKKGHPARQVPQSRKARLHLLKRGVPALAGGTRRRRQHKPERLPYVPTDQEVRNYYEAVWQARRSDDIVMIKTLLYTGVRAPSLSLSASPTSASTPAASGSTWGKGRRTGSCPSRPPSGRHWSCTWTRCALEEPATSSSPIGRDRIRPAAFVHSLPATPIKPAFLTTWPPTVSATSSSPR